MWILYKTSFNHHNALQCENIECNLWYHLKCTKISYKTYTEFNKNVNTDIWTCTHCYNFPFSHVNTNDWNRIILDCDKLEKKLQKLIDIKNPVYSTKCTICERKISSNKIYKGIPCNSCNCLIQEM